MNITLIGYGTRGDAQLPLILGHALQQRGHRVRLLLAADSKPLADRTGLACVPIPMDVQALFSDPAGQAMLARGDIASFFTWIGEVESANAGPIRGAVIEGCGDADLIVSDALMLNRAAAVAAVRGVPVVPLSAFPWLRTSAHPSPFITTRNLGPLNGLTQRLLMFMMWRTAKRDVNAMRAELGVPPARRNHGDDMMASRQRCLLAYSPRLSPRPSDWHPEVHVVGSLRMPESMRAALGENGLPDTLEAWLDAGPAPIYFGLGSMPVSDPAPMMATLKTVLKRVGQRALVCAGWSKLVADDDEQLYVTASVNHERVLPRCRAAVHHGGSGTVFASLGAGLPTVICAVFADQPYWGSRVVKLGVGATFPFKRLDEAQLQRALATCMEPATMARARELGAQLAAEDGASRAVELIEDLL